jgi:hypothetical protein
LLKPFTIASCSLIFSLTVLSPFDVHFRSRIQSTGASIIGQQGRTTACPTTDVMYFSSAPMFRLGLSAGTSTIVGGDVQMVESHHTQIRHIVYCRKLSLHTRSAVLSDMIYVCNFVNCSKTQQFDLRVTGNKYDTCETVNIKY